MVERKKVAVWAGVGCGALLLLACCVSGIGIYVCKSELDEPAAYSHAFFRDLREERYEDAYKRMSGAYQATHSVEDFRARVQELPALRSHTDSSLDSRSIQDDTAEMKGHLETASGEVSVTVQLSREIGHWYIDWVDVGGEHLR